MILVYFFRASYYPLFFIIRTVRILIAEVIRCTHVRRFLLWIVGLCARTPMGCELLREQFDWPAVECGSRDSRESAYAVDAIVRSVRASELDAACSADAGGLLPEAEAAVAEVAAAARDALDESQSERGFTEFGVWVGEERSPSGSTTSSAGGPAFFTQNSDGGSLASAEQQQQLLLQQQPALQGP